MIDLGSIRHQLIHASLVTLLLHTGCQSVHPGKQRTAPPVVEEGDPTLLDTESILPIKNSTFAKALAYYSQGLIHDAHGEISQAATNYVHAIEVEPELDEVYLRASKRLIALERNQDAIALIQRLSARRSEDATPHLWQAVIHQAFDHEEEAIASYQAAIKINPRAIEPYLEAVGMLYRQQRYSEAITLLEQAIDRASNPKEAYRYLADLYQKRSNASSNSRVARKYRRKAISTLKRSISSGNDDATVRWHLARLMIKEGDFENGLRQYIVVDQQDPDDLSLKEKLAGDLVEASGGVAPATDKLNRYLRSHPDNNYAWFYLGSIHEKEKQHAQARQAYVNATMHLPAQSAAFWKAALLSIEEDVRDARRLLERGLDALPDNARIMEMLAFIYLQEKQYERSVEQFERVDAILTQRGVSELAEKFHYNYALAAQGAGELDSAASHLGTALEINVDLLSGFILHVSKLTTPHALKDGLRTLRHVSLRIHEPEVHYYIGVLSRYSKQYEASVSAFAYAQTMALGHEREAEILTAQFYFSFASACEQSQQYAKAEIHFKRSLELDPDYAEARNYLAYMWSEQNINLSEALNQVQHALVLEPDNGAFLDTRGWIYYRQGNWKRALADLERAYELIPDDSVILEHLGDIHAQLNNLARAQHFWRLASGIDPMNSSLRAKSETGDPATLTE